MGREGLSAGLKEIVADSASRGIDLSTDPRLTEAIMLDSFPEAPAEIHAIVEAIRSGAIEYMRDRALQGAAFSIHGSALQLSDKAGLREDLAKWAVAAWWDALNLGGSRSAASLKVGPEQVIGGHGSPGWNHSHLDDAPLLPLLPPSGSAGPIQAVPEEGPPAPSGGTTVSGGESPPLSRNYPRWARRNIGARRAEEGGAVAQPFEASPSISRPGGEAGLESNLHSESPLFDSPDMPMPPASPPLERPVARPVSPGRRRSATLVVALAVVTLVAYIAAARVAHLPPFTSNTASTTSANSVTATTSTSLSQKLASAVPNVGQCAGLTVDQIGSEAPGASAAERCAPDTGLSVVYSIFSSDGAASTDYTRKIKDAGSTSGSCPQGASYSEGFLSCYSVAGARDVLWWYFSDRIVSLASSTSLSFSAILRDWKRLGPT